MCNITKLRDGRISISILISRFNLNKDIDTNRCIHINMLVQCHSGYYRMLL